MSSELSFFLILLIAMKTSLQTYWSRIRPGRTLFLTKPQGPRPWGGLGSLAGWGRPLGLAIFLLLSGLSNAQDGSNDPTFNPTDVGFNNGSGPNSTVRSMAVQADGKILMVGGFTSYNGTGRNFIARLNANGSLDTDFNPGAGPNNYVYSVAVQGDGKILIGGDFTSYNGTSRNRIARLNADGTLDADFNPGTGTNSSVNSVAVQADGKILIGGRFTSYNGTGRGGIARLNADGSPDTGFNSGAGTNSSVNSVAVQADGKILIGGTFTSYNGTDRAGIARLNANGSLDTDFNPGSGANSSVESVAVQADGNILIGGGFTFYNGTGRNRIARLKTDGTLDTDFDPGAGTTSIVLSVAVQADGQILIGGNFTSYNNMGRNRITRLNANGSPDTGFNSGAGADGPVYSFAVQGDGKILIGGSFFTYNNAGRIFIARLNADGTLDTGFNPSTGANDTVYTVAVQGDSKILIGGDFTSYNNTGRSRIARLNADGTLDTNFDPGAGASSIVRSVVVQGDGKVLIGGFFTQYNGTGSNYIARLNADGSPDTGFDPGTGANGTVYSIAVQGDGKVLIGGSFTQYNGTGRNYIARLNANGSLDTGFNPGTGASGVVWSVVVQGDGKILIGGSFTQYNGTGRNYIARLNANGSLDTDFNPGTGANNGTVYSIAVQGDGKVLIGGGFSTYNNTGRFRIARLKTDGTLDPDFNLNTGTDDNILSVAVQADGKILIGGFFTKYNNVGRNFIARLNINGSLDTGFDPGTGAGGTGSNAVRSVVVQGNGKILIGGTFTAYNGTGRNRIARLVPRSLTLTGFVANPATVCVGSVASFTATVGNLTGSYSYTLTTGTSSTTGTATSATFSQTLVAGGTGPQTVTLTVSSGNQLATANTPLTVNAPPVATLTSTPSATLSCGQTSLTLTAGGGTGYVFSGPGIFSQSGNQAVINAPGSYSVSVTNAGCPSSSTTSIAISQDNASPAASLASSGALSCAVTSVTLTANAGSGLSYLFSSGATQVGTSHQAVVNTSGTYSVTVITGSGCASVASTTVTADQTPPTVSVSPTSGTLTCSNPSLTLTANTSASRLTWSTGQTSAQITVDLASTYSVTATGPNGCSATSNSVLIESSQSAPPATLLASGALSCAVTSVTLTANAGSGLSYLFSSGATQVGTSHQAVVNASGPYSVTVTSANGCSAVASTTVTSDQSVPVAELTNNGPISRSTTSVTLTASGGSTYRFSTGATQIGSGPTATVSNAGIYSVTVVSGNGCSAVASTTVSGDQPFITALSPTRNARNAPATTNVAITFDQSISSGIATLGAVRVFSQQRGGLLRNGQGGSTSASGNTLTFDPTTNFRPGETILTTVSTQAQSSGGASLARGQVHQFTVGVGGTGVGNFTDHPTNPNPAVGSQPRSVALGDVDGDGDLDLLTANIGNNNMSVRLNDGSGNFTAPATNPDLTVGDSPQSVALGDIDGDGDLDLLTANYGSNTVSVQLNDGSGNFTDHPTNPALAVGDSPQSVALGDVDGDSDLDLLTANANSANVSVLLNDGSGNFTPPAINPNPTVGDSPQSVALGDVDGDGDLDLLTANIGNNNVSVRFNDGSGNFTDPATNPDPAVGNGPRNVMLGDIDGDGDLDLLTANLYGDNISVLLNDGSGNFTDHPTNPNLPVGSSPYSVVLGDVDGDGDLDLLTANPGNNNVSVLLNDGLGNFTDQPTNPNPAVGNGPVSVAVGDVDGDGDLDLLTANISSDNVSVLLNQSLDVAPTIIGFNALENPVCESSPLTFTATVGNLSPPYAFTLSNGSSTTLGSAATTTFSQVLTASGSGMQTFTLTVSSQGQVVTATTSVTVNALPVAGLVANGPLSCSQPSVTLTASGGGTYQFSNGARQINGGNTATVSTAGVYSVTVTSANGCTATASTSIGFTNDLVATAGASSSTAPVGSVVSLTASGGSTYQWLAPPGTLLSSPATSSLVSATLTASGPKTFTVIVSQGSCSQNLTVDVTATLPPDLIPLLYVTPSLAYNTTTGSVVVDVFEINSTPTSGTIRVHISKSSLLSLSFDPGATGFLGHPVQNSVWTFDGTSNSNAYILTTTQVIGAGSRLSVGLSSTLTPGQTRGRLSITATLVGGSGGEMTLTNNTDADQLEYFNK